MRRPSQFPIAVRVYGAFGTLVILGIALAVLASLAAEQARSNAERFRTINERTFAILEMRLEVAELQRSVQLFASNGQTSLATEASERIERLRVRFDATEVLISGDEAESVLARMQSSLDTYQSSLDSAVTERRTRADLVQKDVARLDARVAELLESLRKARADPARVAELAAAARLLHGNVYQYVYDPDFALLDESARVVRGLHETAVGESDSELLEALDEYQRTFVRIVQSTRGYLYLVGVVMAGEAWDFTYLTERLERLTLADVPRAVAEIEQLSAAVRRRTVVLGAIAVGVAAFLSWWIAGSITGPVRKIAATLSRLADGEHVEHVPGIERRDELGRMATAADAFKRTNERTEQLLDESRALAQELDASRVELQRSNDELEQFVYTVSHDLKTPVVTSLGFIGMMRELAKEGRSDDALAKLPVLERSGTRMKQLIGDLLELSRVGRIDDELETVEPNPAIDGVVDQLRGRIESAGCQIIVEPDLPSIRVNPTRFQQVIDNLLTNAMKYGRPADGPFEVRIESRSSPDTGRVVLAVVDRGAGIAPAHHVHALRLFNRLSSEGEGTGVGLAIVDRIMKTSGGEIRIDSLGNGTGCTFELTFQAGAIQGEHAA